MLFSGGGQGDPALRRAFLRAEHGRRPPGEAVACRPPSFFTSFLHSVFSFFDFLHFGHIHVFCEEGVKMCFFRFWLFSAVFLCGRFQYDVSNRWNSAVFVFSTVFVWIIPVLWYTNKSYFCNFCVCAILEVSPTDGQPSSGWH